jgi:hypothetical protein
VKTNIYVKKNMYFHQIQPYREMLTRPLNQQWNKCIDNIIPTVTLSTYANQKPWITGSICTELKARAAALKERDTNPDAYKKSRYALRRNIKQAKHQYRTKIESYYTGSDARLMWHCLQTITNYKGKPSRELPSDASLPDKLNARQATLKHGWEHQLFRTSVWSCSP